MGKKRCKACRRRAAEAAEKRNVASWECEFSDDGLWCTRSEIPLDVRRHSVCPSCERCLEAMRKEEEEDARFMAEMEDILRNPEKYGYGEE
jgi:hypothetical protein